MKKTRTSTARSKAFVEAAKLQSGEMSTIKDSNDEDPISLSLIGSLTWFKTRTPAGLLGSHMNLPYRAASKHLGAMGE